MTSVASLRQHFDRVWTAGRLLLFDESHDQKADTTDAGTALFQDECEFDSEDDVMQLLVTGDTAEDCLHESYAATLHSLLWDELDLEHFPMELTVEMAALCYSPFCDCVGCGKRMLSHSTECSSLSEVFDSEAVFEKVAVVCGECEQCVETIIRLRLHKRKLVHSLGRGHWFRTKEPTSVPSDTVAIKNGNDGPRFYPLVLLRHSSRMDTAKCFDWEEYESRWFDSPLVWDKQIETDITESVKEMLRFMAVSDATDTSHFIVESSPFLRCVETAAVATKVIGGHFVDINYDVFATPSKIDGTFSAERGAVASGCLDASGKCVPFASTRYLTRAQMAERSPFIAASEVELRCADGVDDSSPLLPQHVCDPKADSAQRDESWAAHVSQSVAKIMDAAVARRRTVVLVTHGEVIRVIASRLLQQEIAKVRANGWLTIPHCGSEPVFSAGIVWK